VSGARPRAGSLLRKYGPWALVTGAAQGIGAEFAEQIADAGLNLVLVDIDEDRLRARCLSLREKRPVEIRPVVLDLRREDLLDSTGLRSYLIVEITPNDRIPTA
jgi:short-subunit dehydrogenase